MPEKPVSRVVQPRPPTPKAALATISESHAFSAASIATAAQEMAAEADAVTQHLVDISELWSAMGLTVGGSILLEEDPEAQHARIDLAYAREDGRWGLYIEHVVADHFADEDTVQKRTPIKKASRKHRTLAGLKIKDLLAHIGTEVAKQRSDLQTALANLREVASGLPPKPATPAVDAEGEPLPWNRPPPRLTGRQPAAAVVDDFGDDFGGGSSTDEDDKIPF